MDPDEGKDKFYININVQHNPNNGFTSEANARYKFDKPLIDKSGNFQVCVTDMQVDTKAVPLFVAEYYKTQEYSSLQSKYESIQGYNNTDVKLNYWVQVYTEFTNGEKVYLRKPIRFNAVPWTRGEKGKYEYNNNNENAFIYSHQEFIDMVNIALDNALPAHLRGKATCGFIIRNERLMFCVQDSNFYRKLITTKGNCVRIYFSNSLYQYLGLGFPIISRGLFWEYDFVPIVLAENRKDSYFTMMQSVPSLQSWNGCKAIVCYTKDLPVVDEVFPTTAVQPHLAHYGNSDSVDSHYILGKGDKKILFVHYIDYNRIRTLSNGIVVHNMCVDDGLKIDLDKTLPIDTFDIHFGWIDSFGNLFPLKLTYGCCCNVRLCFTRKKEHENYDYTKGPNGLPQAYIPPADYGYYVTPYEAIAPGSEMNVDENTKQGLYGWTPSMENVPTLAPEVEQHNSPDYLPDVTSEMPVEPLILFAQHLANAVEQQLENNTQEQAVVPEVQPEEPPPLLDEKEQFYKRQQEILEQYKQFNNNLNLN